MFGLDGGRGSVELCLNFMTRLFEKEEPSNKKPRFSYQDEVMQEGFKEGGVKKLIILGLVEKVKESYENLKKIMKLSMFSTWTLSKQLILNSSNV